MEASGGEARAARPRAVLAAAVICFLQAAVFGVNMLVGLGIAALGFKGLALHDSATLLLGVGLAIGVFCLAVGILYLVGGRRLLRGRRGWHRAVLVLFCLTIVGGLGAYFAQGGNPWDLVLPVGSTAGLLLLAFPRSRAWFAPPAEETYPTGADSSSS